MTEPAPAEPGRDGNPTIDPDLQPGEDVRGRADTSNGSLADLRQRRLPRLSGGVLAAVFAGGVAGGLARYAVTERWATADGGFPWATFTVNTAGVLALALLVVVLAEVAPASRYVRPLLGTGFLGAFTTFSSVVTATDQLAAHGHLRTAVLYLAGSLLAALAAGSSGLLLGRAVTAAYRHRGRARTSAGTGTAAR